VAAINFMENIMEKYNPEEYELLASHIEIFRKAFGAYLKQYEQYESVNNKSAKPDGLNVLLFDELFCNYYKTVISALKKLAKYDEKYISVLIETYEELWMSAPRLNDRNYICPYLLDLCKFLYGIKKTAPLTFFYNLLIYCREIPFLSLNEEHEKVLSEAYKNNGEEDPFAEFRKERAERITESFDKALFDKTYDKFFLILSGWRERIEGYYTKDEIYFMNGLFIMDELSDQVYFKERNPKKIFRKDCKTDVDSMTDGGAGGGKNIYEYAYDGEIREKISDFYEKALKYFKLSINYNPNNPRYYYEYARCLKNSGKSEEAEIFFKKAFDLNG
jgi:tetratricopeptide (TPR) repeat protein